MATTTTNLNKIHVFPNNNSFQNNLSSVSDSDLAFIKSDILNELSGNTAPALFALIDWDTMKIRNNGTDVRNINNTGAGIKAYGGDNSFPTTSGGKDSAKATIMLKKSYDAYDKILVVSSNDSGNYLTYTLINTWDLRKRFQEGYRFFLFHDDGTYWLLYSGVNSGTTTHLLSTDTIWYTQDQNCSIVEIYGLKY